MEISGCLPATWIISYRITFSPPRRLRWQKRKNVIYTAKDALRECKELLEEGYGFSGVRIFLNDLARSKDITWEENLQIMNELMQSGIDCSIATF